VMTTRSVRGPWIPGYYGDAARKLGEYPIPDEYKGPGSGNLQAVAKRRLVSLGVLLHPGETVSVSAVNARPLLHELLWLEEMQMKRDIRTYDQNIEVPLMLARQDAARCGADIMYKIQVPGLAEKRPSVLRGDTVWITVYRENVVFSTTASNVKDDIIEILLPPDFRNRPPFTVRFSYNRTPLRHMHRAIDERLVDVFSPRENMELLMMRARVLKAYRTEFSAISALLPSWLSTNTTDAKLQLRVQTLKATGLNEEQVLFVEAVLTPVKQPLPVLCWGPPGCGKSHVVCVAIRELIRNEPDARCLVCCPSNTAVDVLCSRLGGKTGGCSERELLRINARSRTWDEVPSDVAPFCPFRVLQDGTKEWKIPEVVEIEQCRVVLCTCSFAGTLLSRFSVGSSILSRLFTHCFIDEAGQAMEPEAWIPLSLLKPGGKCFFVGDHKQLGSVVRNSYAVTMGLEISIQERMWKMLESSQHSGQPTRCFALTKSYRAHPSILKLFNETVYGGVLQCYTKLSSVSQFLSSNSITSKGLDGTVHPLRFHHVVGEEEKQQGSPSWQNSEELRYVQYYVTQLILVHRVQRCDIGIISPYRQQCTKIRQWLTSKGWSDITVGTVENFQGGERDVIVVSTVRSKRTDELNRDMKFSIGFLGSFRRTNVAISRAKALLIVIGNLKLLGQDNTWSGVLKIAARMNAVWQGEPQHPTALTYQEVQTLVPSMKAGEIAFSVNAADGRIKVDTRYSASIAVVDDGVRHAQGAAGLGLGISAADPMLDDSIFLNSEAAWRDFDS